jgi:hypothetical protein
MAIALMYRPTRGTSFAANVRRAPAVPGRYNIRMKRALGIVLPLLLLTTGCAHYEYDLTAPADLARHIGTKADEVVRLDPLEYRLRSYDDHLVMQIFNPTADPITLLGDQSYAVAPDGQSHPLRGQTIAPNTFVKLIFPPPRPYYQSSPSIGIGFGVGVSHHLGAGYYSPLYDPFWDEPRYYTYYDANDTSYWDWNGESNARIHLTYQRAGKNFAHEFSFHRKKM